LMQMQVKTRRYQRTMEMEAWSMGDEHSLVLIQQPVKDKGIATLKVEENIWNYLPKINRVTKVPASMMSGSWMGSHFTQVCLRLRLRDHLQRQAGWSCVV
ncbi:outer membrane lipoprotein-sorting protein, partial [Oceanospirillum sp. HFRX-1_2]